MDRVHVLGITYPYMHTVHNFLSFSPCKHNHRLALVDLPSGQSVNFRSHMRTTNQHCAPHHFAWSARIDILSTASTRSCDQLQTDEKHDPLSQIATHPRQKLAAVDVRRCVLVRELGFHERVKAQFTY